MEREADGRARLSHLLDPSPHLIKGKKEGRSQKDRAGFWPQSQPFMMLCPWEDRRQRWPSCPTVLLPTRVLPKVGRIKISEKPTCLFIINIS